ncbi:Hsp20/alpha crystallin family protein [Luteolibacter pohnpeiensis]|uniref:Hsp20/alpha crystallin family protein n=1 Tax=Luteolibacter pohnpeiensis TaxID=454153 RepID=A0A934S9J3_9BACT|nr:Hsp20/alpha crystallin family protein [Luteolibacter pohnpeiensis]MBK1882132.1 Hsp20/alpha crystallin family protein [Luteolibacter pohnpeiensis]
MNNNLCNPTTQQRTITPATQTYEDENGIRLEVALPGVSKEDLKIKLNDSALHIEAPRSSKVPENWKASPSNTAPVQYQLQAKLTRRLDGNRIEANLENGVLTLLIPFSEAAKPREILVN